MDANPLVDIIKAARQIIADQPDIGKGDCGPKDENGDPILGEGVYGLHECTCAGYAIGRAEGYASPSPAFLAFQKANGLSTSQGSIFIIAEWNDQPERTKQDVLEAFDKTLAYLAARAD